MVAYIDAMTRILVGAGIAEGTGATDARALAHTLCWMTERALYRASQTSQPQDLRTASETCAEIWCRTIDRA
jgi:hypothetical protein